MVSLMSKTTSFEGELTDQERLRAKLKDIDSEIEQQKQESARLDDELSRVYEVLEGLERVRDGLLVILGEKKPESDQARFEREEEEANRERRWRASFEQALAASIQAQVENLVNALGRQVSAGELLEHLPAGTKPEAVNYALWRAADKGRIRKVSRGVYVANLTVLKTAKNEGR
jgi:translation elongation factor EF-G